MYKCRLKAYCIVLLLFATMAICGQSFNAKTADSLYALGNYTAAINQYAKLGDANAGHQIARAYNALGNFDKAITQYKALLKAYPQLAIARFELGKLQLKTKDYPRALTNFKLLLEKDDQNPAYHYYFGRTWQQMGQFPQAINSFKRAAQKDTTHLKSLYALGKFYVSVKEKDSALKYIDQGLRFYDKDIALINLKALTLFNNAEFEKAIPYFKQLLDLGEQKPFIYRKLGYAHFKNWDFKEAKEAYRVLEGFLNMEAAAYTGLGEVFLKEKQLDSAKYYVKKSIEERRVIFDNEYKTLGHIAHLQQDLELSLHYYNLAWQEDPADQFAYWQICVIADQYYKDPKVKLKQYQKLLSDFEDLMPFLKVRAQKRVSELKEEIHFAKD